MRCLFLDIDGVMNNNADFYEMRKYGHPFNKGAQVINRGALAILQTVIENTDAKIVFTTAWRRDFNCDDFHTLFTVRGWELDRDVMIGCTPVLNRENHWRGREIRQYLNEHPEVTDFVIIDDNTDCIESEGFVPVSVNRYDTTGDFITTNTDSGLTVTQALHASWALGLNKQAIEADEQRRRDLDLLIGCML